MNEGGNEKRSHLPASVSSAIQRMLRFLNPYDKTGISQAGARVSGLTIFIRNMLAGGVSASIAVTVMAPIERIKLILQIQNTIGSKPGKTPYRGLMDALVRIPKEQGFLAFWRGNAASVMRGFPYQALNFALRDRYKDIFVRRFNKTDQLPTRVFGNLFVGGLSGTTSMAILYPLDYARTRMALDLGKTKKERDTKGIRGIIMETYRRDGFKGLYRGFWFSLVGVFIYRSTYFGLFDTAKDAAPLFGIERFHQTFVFAFMAAEMSASVSGALAYPFDTVRRSIMMETGKPKSERVYQDSWDCMKTIYQKKGVRGFYHGGWVNVIRGTGGALMLVIYDEIQHEMWRRETLEVREAEERRNRRVGPERRTPADKTPPPCLPSKPINISGECDESDENCPVRNFAERVNLICDH